MLQTFDGRDKVGATCIQVRTEHCRPKCEKIPRKTFTSDRASTECRVDKGSDCNIIVAYITKLFTINNSLSCTAPAINGAHLRLYWPQHITGSGICNKCFSTYKYARARTEISIRVEYEYCAPYEN